MDSYKIRSRKNNNNGIHMLLKNSVKRTFDVAISFTVLIILLPLFVAVAALIIMEDGMPFIFTQTRIGKDCKPFKMYKFRSMEKKAETQHEALRKKNNNTEISFKMQHDPRVTKVGYWIRKFNIDELPQLINILKGEMSIVGPRPLPDYEYKEERKQYGNKYMQRYLVPQGLTCYWQLSDRAKIDFEDRMKMDVKYAREWTLTGDICLIIKTFFYTITGKAEY